MNIKSPILSYAVLRPYLIGMLLTVAVVAIKLLLPDRIGFSRPYLLFVLPILVVALIGSLRATLTTLVLALLAILYIFLPPHYSWAFTEKSYIDFMAYTFQSAVIIWLAQKFKNAHNRYEELNRQLEKRVKERTKALTENTRKLESQRKQLLVLNKAIDEFAALVSHQLKTPATGVRQYIGMLQEGYAGPLNNDQQTLLASAHESNERQLRIIDDLLQISRLEAGKIHIVKRPTNIVAMVQNVINEQQTTFKSRNQTVAFTSPTKAALMANVDGDRLRMVIENILDNASKYTPENKEIRVKVYKRTGSVNISIADQGVGIAQKDMSRLFKRFSKITNALSENVGGNGLGLYWAKKIISMHHGDITVSSRPGRGSTFIVSIPVS